MVVRRALPIVAIAAPPVAWVTAQQAMGELVYVACGSGGPPFGPAVAILSLLVCATSTVFGWTRRSRRAAAWAAVGSGAIFALGCLALLAASLLVPPCAR